MKNLITITAVLAFTGTALADDMAKKAPEPKKEAPKDAAKKDAPKDAPKDGKDAKVEKAERPRRGGPADESLTPEQRATRRKEMAAKREAKLTELKEKKAGGTLTEKEQQQLDRLEKSGRPGRDGRRQSGDKKKEQAL